LRAYQPGDEEQILALFERVFGIRRSPAHWRWKFLDNPAGRQISLALGPDGRIVGQFAALPAAAVTPQGSFVLAQGIDHMVAPEAQQRGVFAALTRHFSEAFLGPGRDVAYYSYPLAHKHSIDERITDAELIHPVSALVWPLGRVEGWRPAPAGTWRTLRHRVRRVERFDASVARLWQRVRDELGVAAVRDSRYLNWRYADCPDVDYALLQIEGRIAGGVRGIAVLRFGWFDEPVATLLELLLPAGEEAALRLLLAACHDLARERGLWCVKTWIPPGAALQPVLRALGYDAEPTPFLLTRIADADPQRGALMRRRWYYTMGDSDVY